jgi:hypothetical protein
LLFLCHLAAPVLFGAEKEKEKEPSVDEIIASVEKQIAPKTKELIAGAAETSSVIQSAELRLHHEIMKSKDRRLRVIYSISCLNSSIGYIESHEGLKEREKVNYERMVRFREILAKEYLALSK